MLTDGTAPIYVRITVADKRIEIASKRNIDPEKWNTDAQKADGNSEDARTINSYLKLLEQNIYNAHQQLIQEGKTISVETLKNKLTGKKETFRSLVAIFTDHNNRVKALVNLEYAPGTLQRYQTTLKHTIDFLEWKYQISDIDIKSIGHEFITSFEFYLRSIRKCNNNSAVKYIKNFKKIIRICIASGWLTKDPFVNYKSRVKEVKRDFLTEEELKRLADKQFSFERLNQVKDIFMFSCFTGLAYADTKKLRRSEIIIGIDGEKWVFTSRQKTDTESRIPLLPQALQIIERYKDHPQCNNTGRLLPVLSNQKMNSYLKEIGDQCGIRKQFTYHTARHTFATTVTLSNGVPIETVSKMLGHKNLRTTQHYAKILDRKVSQDMQLLKQKLSTF
jgi:site-specific recombinase XerD